MSFANYMRIADRCGGCQEFKSALHDEDRGVTLGSCKHNPRPGSINDGSPKCAAYRAIPELSAPVVAAAASPPRPAAPDPVALGVAKDTLRALLREALWDLLGPDKVEIADRWEGGKLVMEPGRSGVLGKEVPIEAFFNKIIMVRDRLRVLEAKINAHPNLPYTDKVELQGYITKCYGSLTTFNVLFAEERDKFVGEKKGR